jgi:hypothetical protein
MSQANQVWTKARQIPIALAPSPVRDLTPEERANVITLLAQLILQASGWAHKEADDERL